MLILLVDDVRATREIYRFMLERLGNDVIEAADGTEAIRSAASNRPDMILMDLQMPGVDGLVATAALRTISTMQHVPIVAMTAFPKEFVAAKALSVGCDAFVEKPLTVEALATLIRRLLPVRVTK
jgi:two-component system, cell cycle response regulator DivK